MSPTGHFIPPSLVFLSKNMKQELMNGTSQYKMAEYVATGDSSLQVLPPTKDKINESICKNCNAYESHLKKVLEELETARAIIDILQREVHTTTTTENTCDEQTNTKGWTTVSSRNNSIKTIKSSLCKPKVTEQYIVTTNRFTPLNNLQASNAESNGLQTLQVLRKQKRQTSTKTTNETSNQHRKGMKIPTITNVRLIYGGDWKPTTRKKEEGKSSTGTRTSDKVKILGDSHLRGTASKIDQYLNTKFEVCSWIKPGATTKEIVNTLVNDLKCLGT